MRVKLATGSCHEQKSSNCTHQSKIKGFNNQWDKNKSQFDVRACPVVRVQCVCALINQLVLALKPQAFWSCALLAGPVGVAQWECARPRDL